MVFDTLEQGAFDESRPNVTKANPSDSQSPQVLEISKIT